MNPMASKRKIEILCPKCGWRPSEDSIWCHDPGCGHIWNAFDTGGICPNCGGELVARPRRPAAKLAAYPASTTRVFKPSGCKPSG